MPIVDLVDETFIAAPAARIAAVVADPAQWLRWWPRRRLDVFMDRGIKGQRWAIAGDLVGTAEIWVEAYRDGAVLHYYIRADPGEGQTLDARGADRLRRAEATAWKGSVWALKLDQEAGRHVGRSAAGHANQSTGGLP